MKFLDVPQSGSIADRTHSHNRAGQYTRNRRAPVQPVGSGRRAIVRSNFASASAGWGELTDAQRSAWGSFALDHPITDTLGSSIILTGHQMYVRVNSTALNVGRTQQETPPADLSLPDLSQADFSASLATNLSLEGIASEADQYAATAYSRPMSPGRTFNKTFWQPPSGISTDPGGGTQLSWAEYSTEFGMPTVGQRIFVRITPVSPDNWNGQPVIISTVVTS